MICRSIWLTLGSGLPGGMEYKNGRPNQKAQTQHPHLDLADRLPNDGGGLPFDLGLLGGNVSNGRRLGERPGSFEFHTRGMGLSPLPSVYGYRFVGCFRVP